MREDQFNLTTPLILEGSRILLYRSRDFSSPLGKPPNLSMIFYSSVKVIAGFTRAEFADALLYTQ